MCRVHTAAGKGEAAGIAKLSYRAGEKLWKTPFSPTSDPPPPPEIMLTGCYEIKQANKRGLNLFFWDEMQPNGKAIRIVHLMKFCTYFQTSNIIHVSYY